MLEDSLTELFDFVKRNNFKVLPIQFENLLALNSLPFIHKDPFDRLIIAQGISEKIPIATKDAVFSDYEVEIIW